jgi:phosphatidylinositol alpha-1,6-mannosyltransferase
MSSGRFLPSASGWIALSARSVQRPRVLVLTPDYPPAFGGIQELACRVVRGWSRLDSRVVTLRTPGSSAFDESARQPVRRAPQPRFAGRRAAMLALNGAAAVESVRFRPDVVFSIHIAASLAAYGLRLVARVPYVQYVHGMEVAARPRLAALVLGAADAIAVNSAYTERLALRSGARRDRIRVILPGVAPVSRPCSADRARPRVVVVSRLDERYKGHDVLIRAMPLVRARVPDARLVVIGDGALRPSYERLAAALGISSSVDFRGAVTPDERDVWLDRAHVFAMPSRLAPDGGGEGFGIAYLEAAAHGLPVVAGNVGGAMDAVVDGETGVLVEPTDHVAVGDAIADLLVDRDKAARLGQAGRDRAKRYTWERTAAEVEELLLAVADRHAGSLR